MIHNKWIGNMDHTCNMWSYRIHQERVYRLHSCRNRHIDMYLNKKKIQQNKTSNSLKNLKQNRKNQTQKPNKEQLFLRKCIFSLFVSMSKQNFGAPTLTVPVSAHVNKLFSSKCQLMVHFKWFLKSSITFVSYISYGCRWFLQVCYSVVYRNQRAYNQLCHRTNL